MATITLTRGTTLPDSASKTDFHNLIDTATGTLSGGITTSDISASAGIVGTQLSASAAIAPTQLAQITTASKVHGSSITGLASVPAGAGVIPVANLGSGTPDGTKFLKDDGTFTAPTILAANMPSGSVIQSRYDVSGTLDSTTTVLPYDNSLPTDSEGKASDLSVAITPNADGNTIEVNACVQLGSSTSSPPTVAALFEGTTCVAYQAATTSDIASVVLFYRKAGSVGTSEITYTVRFGPGSAGTCVYNGDLAGTVLGGTATKSYLKVQEIKA